VQSSTLTSASLLTASGNKLLRHVDSLFHKVFNTEHPVESHLRSLKVPPREGGYAMSHIAAESYPICPLCSEHVEIESTNTDDKGRAVHEECYVAHTIELFRLTASDGKNLATQYYDNPSRASEAEDQRRKSDGVAQHPTFRR